MKRQIMMFLLSAVVLVMQSLAQSRSPAGSQPASPAAKEANNNAAMPRITFVELGSVNCIPCKAMQPVMKSIEEKYGSQVKVIFYDVWKKERAHFAQQYKVRLIPTQVFLDSRGNELMRHEGFFPEKEIDAFLQSKGMKPNPSEKE